MAPASERHPRPRLLAAVLVAAAAADSAGEARAGSLVAAGLPHIAAAFRGAQDMRRLQRSSQGTGTACRAVALRLMPPPALQSYQACFQDKLHVNSSHDWSVPGAELAAQVDCWCANNLTSTIQEYQCCEHPDLYPMCSVDCEPDCSSQLATTCIQECPSMCFEASEYAVDAALCSRCNWQKCWPAIKCLTAHAATRVENGTLDPTCHETRFRDSTRLQKYWQCWRDAPKHSSHWNVWSSVVNCICREGIVGLLQDTDCCGSALYGGGACDVTCPADSQCMSQEAQTCIHSCGAWCDATELSPSTDCLKRCLHVDAPCRKYLGCRPPMLAGHVCDDGRWPEASSGCCAMNRTDRARGQLLGCPRLCDTQRVWRLDGGRVLPWWSRWQPDYNIVAQCVCEGCPTSSDDATLKLASTVEESLWDNGQTMLVDIARREGLMHGPNRQMQELMVERNQKIASALKAQASHPDQHSGTIASINDQYARLITLAARQYGDDGYVMPTSKDASNSDLGDGIRTNNFLLFTVVAGLCTCAIVAAIGLATKVILKRRRESPVSGFQANAEVVIGNPVMEQGSGGVGAVTGAPVTVSAPTKGSRDSPAKDLS